MCEKVIFRVDGGGAIGLGHIVRSICVANTLRNNFGNTPIFLTKTSEVVKQLLINADLSFELLEENIDEIEQVIKCVIKNEAKVVYFDNLKQYTTSEVDCINQYARTLFFHNLSVGASKANFVILPSEHTDTNLYAHLKNNENFRVGGQWVVVNEAIESLRKEDVKVVNNSIGITTGGSDPANVMLRLLKYFIANPIEGICINAYIGQNAVHKQEIEEYLSNHRTDNIKTYPFSLKELIGNEVVICTFGVTTYELIALGKPIISVGHAPLNANGSRLLAQNKGCILDAGYVEELNEQDFIELVDKLMRSQENKEQLISNCQGVVDVNGAKRVAQIINSLNQK